MAKIKQLKDKSGTEQIFPKTKTQAIFNEDGSLLSDTLDDLYGSLATIESSPTTTSHSVGEYILYEGQVYKVTSVIASGDSLVVGTNISAVNLGNQISTLNSKFITRDYSVTTTTNPNVSPFSAYETTSASGPSGYKAISICPVGLGSSNPVLCRLFNDEGGFFTYSASPITITVRIVYEKI